MARDGRSDGPWGRLPARYRVLVTNLLLAVIVILAFGRVQLLWRAWRMSGDETIFGAPWSQESRILSFAEALRFAAFEIVAAPTGLSAVAAFAVLFLVAHPKLSRLPLTWRRSVAGVTLGAVGLTLLESLIRLYVTLYAHTTAGPQDWMAGLDDGQSGLAAVLAGGGGAGAEAVVAVVLIILGLAWWPGRGGDGGLLATNEDDLDEDDLDEDDAEDERRDVGDDLADAGDADEGGYAAPRERATAADPAEQAAPRPRLQPDGSSESGYDEFRFGR